MKRRSSVQTKPKVSKVAKSKKLRFTLTETPKDLPDRKTDDVGRSVVDVFGNREMVDEVRAKCLSFVGALALFRGKTYDDDHSLLSEFDVSYADPDLEITNREKVAFEDALHTIFYKHHKHSCYHGFVTLASCNLTKCVTIELKRAFDAGLIAVLTEPNRLKRLCEYIYYVHFLRPSSGRMAMVRLKKLFLDYIALTTATKDQSEVITKTEFNIIWAKACTGFEEEWGDEFAKRCQAWESNSATKSINTRQKIQKSLQNADYQELLKSQVETVTEFPSAVLVVGLCLGLRLRECLELTHLVNTKKISDVEGIGDPAFPNIFLKNPKAVVFAELVGFVRKGKQVAESAEEPSHVRPILFPSLCTEKILKQAFETLRSSSLVGSSRNLSRIMRPYLTKLFGVPMLYKDLRSLYGMLTMKEFASDRVTESMWIAKVLNHKKYLRSSDFYLTPSSSSKK